MSKTNTFVYEGSVLALGHKITGIVKEEGWESTWEVRACRPQTWKRERRSQGGNDFFFF